MESQRENRERIIKRKLQMKSKRIWNERKEETVKPHKDSKRIKSNQMLEMMQRRHWPIITEGKRKKIKWVSLWRITFSSKIDLSSPPALLKLFLVVLFLKPALLMQNYLFLCWIFLVKSWLLYMKNNIKQISVKASVA